MRVEDRRQIVAVWAAVASDLKAGDLLAFAMHMQHACAVWADDACGTGGLDAAWRDEQQTQPTRKEPAEAHFAHLASSIAEKPQRKC